MRLANRRPGWSTSFVDASSGEVLFEVSFDREGRLQVGFCLYDADGSLVAQRGLERLRSDITVHAGNGDLLLDLAANPQTPVRYRLHNRAGELVTCSDGVRTRIYGSLRMQGASGHPTAASRRAAAG